MKKMITLLAVVGMVLALAPAVQAQTIITGVTATARSEFGSGESWGRPATNAVNGVGMVSGEGGTGLHQNSDWTTGWQPGQAGTIPHWVKVDLGASYDVGKMYVWNGAPPDPGWGAQTVDIYYSTTDPGNNTHNNSNDFITTGWTLWNSGVTFAQHAGSGNYLPTTTNELNLANVRCIALNVTAAHGGINNTSIAELQFFTPAPPAGTVLISR